MYDILPDTCWSCMPAIDDSYWIYFRLFWGEFCLANFSPNFYSKFQFGRYISFIGKLAISASFGMWYLIIVEVFAVEVSMQLLGFSQILGRAGPIAAPFIIKLRIHIPRGNSMIFTFHVPLATSLPFMVTCKNSNNWEVFACRSKTDILSFAIWLKIGLISPCNFSISLYFSA